MASINIQYCMLSCQCEWVSVRRDIAKHFGCLEEYKKWPIQMQSIYHCVGSQGLCTPVLTKCRALRLQHSISVFPIQLTPAQHSLPAAMHRRWSDANKIVECESCPKCCLLLCLTHWSVVGLTTARKVESIHPLLKHWLCWCNNVFQQTYSNALFISPDPVMFVLYIVCSTIRCKMSHVGIALAGGPIVLLRSLVNIPVMISLQRA